MKILTMKKSKLRLVVLNISKHFTVNVTELKTKENELRERLLLEGIDNPNYVKNYISEEMARVSNMVENRQKNIIYFGLSIITIILPFGLLMKWFIFPGVLTFVNTIIFVLIQFLVILFIIHPYIGITKKQKVGFLDYLDFLKSVNSNEELLQRFLNPINNKNDNSIDLSNAKDLSRNIAEINIDDTCKTRTWVYYYYFLFCTSEAKKDLDLTSAKVTYKIAEQLSIGPKHFYKLFLQVKKNKCMEPLSKEHFQALRNAIALLCKDKYTKALDLAVKKLQTDEKRITPLN